MRVGEPAMPRAGGRIAGRLHEGTHHPWRVELAAERHRHERHRKARPPTEAVTVAIVDMVSRALSTRSPGGIIGRFGSSAASRFGSNRPAATRGPATTPAGREARLELADDPSSAHRGRVPPRLLLLADTAQRIMEFRANCSLGSTLAMRGTSVLRRVSTREARPWFAPSIGAFTSPPV